MDDNIHITIPASSSLELYPENTLAQHTVKLHKPIYLTGEYEIGLESIHITSRVINIGTEDSEITVKRYLVPDSELTPEILHHRKIDSELKHGNVMEYKIHILKGHYKLDILFEDINQQLMKDPTTANYSFVFNNNKLSLYKSYKQGELNVTWKTLRVSPFLMNILRFRNTEVPIDYIYNLPIENLYTNIDEGEFITLRGLPHKPYSIPKLPVKQVPISRKIKIPWNFEGSLNELIGFFNTQLQYSNDTNHLNFSFNYRKDKISLLENVLTHQTRPTWKSIHTTPSLQNYLGLEKIDTPINRFYQLNYKNVDKVKFPENEYLVLEGTTDFEESESNQSEELRTLNKQFYVDPGSYSMSRLVYLINQALSNDRMTIHLQFIVNKEKKTIGLRNLLEMQPESHYWSFVQVSAKLKEIFQFPYLHFPIGSIQEIPYMPGIINMPEGEYFDLIGTITHDITYIERKYPALTGIKVSKTALIKHFNNKFKEEPYTEHLQFQIADGTLSLITKKPPKDDAPDWMYIEMCEGIHEVLNLPAKYMTYNSIYKIPFKEDKYLASDRQYIKIYGKAKIKEVEIEHKKKKIKTDVELFSSGKIKIDAKLYHTLDTLVVAINKSLSKKTATDDLEFELKNNKTLLSIKKESNYNRGGYLKTYFKFTPHLAWLFGLTEYKEYIDSDKITDIAVANDISYTIPRMMFIYCDLCEHSFVGDINARLLKVLRVRAVGQENTVDMSESFDRVSYYNVDKKYIDTITLYIKSSEGHAYPLDAGELITTLHLRRK